MALGKYLKERNTVPVCPVIFESKPMPHPASKNLENARHRPGAPSPWESERPGGDGDAGGTSGGVPPLSNAELVQLQIRVIALENLVVALLARAPDEQLELVRDIAASIFPRPGVEHRLTMHATAQMEHLAQRSLRL
jgi:hypothetical protein